MFHFNVCQPMAKFYSLMWYPLLVIISLPSEIRLKLTDEAFRSFLTLSQIQFKDQIVLKYEPYQITLGFMSHA